MLSGFLLTAPVCPTTHDSVLNAVVKKVQIEVSEFDSDSTCFLSEVATPGIEISESLFCTVSPGDTTFDDRRSHGAGSRDIVESVIVIVTVWSRILLDPLNHSARSLTDSSRGLLRFKKQILRALAGKQLYLDAPTNSVPLLVESLTAVNSVHSTARRRDDDFSSFSINFRGAFCWDLS